MKHNIIKTENYLLVVDDSEIKEGDWIYESDSNSVNIAGKGYHNFTQSDAKITAHLPLNNSPILEGVDLLPPLEDEVDKLAECEYGTDIDSIRGSNHYDLNTDLKRGFVRGYNKAKEKYKYTEEDLIKAWKACLDFNKPAGSDSGINFEDFIQSLQKTKLPVAFDCEMEVCCFGNHTDYNSKIEDYVKPKTTTNSQGITQWVGSYIYE